MSALQPTNGIEENVEEKMVKCRKVVLIPFSYVSSLKGKDFRRKLAVAVNFWYQLTEADLENVLEIINILHNASLVGGKVRILIFPVLSQISAFLPSNRIDDIEDYSDLRRGQAAAHKIFGIPFSINSANYAYFEALKVLLRFNNIKAIHIFTEALLSLHIGQGMELYWRDRGGFQQCPEIVSIKGDGFDSVPSIKEYENVIILKTSGQFILLTDVMKCLSKKSSPVDLTKLTELIGLHFQIRDDFMNITSSEYTSTKGFCEDITEGKLSYLVVYAMNNDSFGKDEKKRLWTILKMGTTEVDIKKEALLLLERSGAIQYTRERLDAIENDIMEQTSILDENPEVVRLLKTLWLH